MRSKYGLPSECNRIIKEVSDRLRKAHKIYSLWNFDEENKTLWIYTTMPGYWIGRAGIGVEELKNSLNAKIAEKNNHLLNVYKNGGLPCEPTLDPLIEKISFEDCRS